MSQIFLAATTTSIENLHAKTTSAGGFKSGSEENKKQRVGPTVHFDHKVMAPNLHFVYFECETSCSLLISI